MTNYERTEAWLKACGKVPGPDSLSVQIGCHLEEVMEFLDCLMIENEGDQEMLTRVIDDMVLLSNMIKRGNVKARINDIMREYALDALCDGEVTGNGVAYLAGFDKRGADKEVLASNDAKLVNGKPVILLGGKIGKPEGWTAPDLTRFV